MTGSSEYQTLEVAVENGRATIWLNRPEIHNAFNATMINELIMAFTRLDSESAVRVIVLRGRGKSFCAGADLNWMRAPAGYEGSGNLDEMREISKCFFKIYSCSKPVISAVHGASAGGANGLVAASDIAICSDDTIFSLGEVRLGLVPSVISPYLIKRIGEFPARDLMLTGRRIFGREAAELGLVSRSYHLKELDQALEIIVGQVTEGMPEAVAACKRLIFDVSNSLTLEESVQITPEILAKIRVSEEGQKGMATFLEKRRPGRKDTNHQQ
jgi:methylglutaconyl-CoA hydratase